ncbi:hypothetical protein B5K08_09885 [Rhizobium leguminosarum bv. trifolii]|uniref:Uncharacterized protein n=1 Tax=Rhizobium leguminosarum bv. trifolii TaxID=386 RepID=A0A3E1BPL2_RHILT|nr:hypothetical protein [Rhizobium leguminosarum]RFB94485.1 hypothetical protein B5K08_09885 [Rhizobium leguminosarum bv. trifolii]RFB95857.1 hypothetical protein B5K10_09870 [Rhizobium leguminosarum bv. trifolii]
MLTDLPDLAIKEIDATLKLLSFRAHVLIEERDDFFTTLCRSLFSNARTIIDGVLAARDLSTKVYICLVVDADRQFQACAMQLNASEYCIMIWVAAPLNTMSITSRLLATPAARELFSLDFQISDPPGIAAGADTFAAYRALSLLPPVRLGGELDNLRMQIDYSAFQWLVLHEMAHILNGHLALGKDINGLTYILEDDPSSNYDENITYQALELDADCFANIVAIRQAIGRPLELEAINTVEGRLKSYVFGILAIIRSFDAEPFEPSRIFQSDHPPGGIRMNYLMSQISTIELDKHVDFGGLNATDVAARTAICVENAISEATGVKGGGGNFQKAFDLGWEPFHVPVLSRWAKILPELNAKKITPRDLAPAQFDPA